MGNMSTHTHTHSKKTKLVWHVTYSTFLPHHGPHSWRRGDDSGCGVVAKPDRLVAFQTLSSERVQQVHLSLLYREKKAL